MTETSLNYIYAEAQKIMDEDNYPLREASFERAPYQRTSITSKEAARAIAGHCGPMECELLNAFSACHAAGADGLTDDELIEAFGTHSVRPRRIYLVLIGKLRDTGTMRKTRSGRRATVWALA